MRFVHLYVLAYSLTTSSQLLGKVYEFKTLLCIEGKWPFLSPLLVFPQQPVGPRLGLKDSILHYSF